MLYKTKGTCSVGIVVELEPDHTIQKVEFIGGCSGNTQGVASLVQGMKAEDAIARLKGIRCGSKATSCPDSCPSAEEAMKERHSIIGKTCTPCYQMYPAANTI